MDQNLEEYYNNLDRIFSAAAPIYDAKIQGNFINVGIREKEIDSVVKRYKKGWKMLEIGCGTGEEARKIIEATSCNITCIDVSKGMIDYATSKMARSGFGNKFHGIKLPASSVGSVNERFGIVYSFNGALNNEPQLTKFFEFMKDIVEEGGYFIVSVRNRFSFGETLIDFVRFRLGSLITRVIGEMRVEVVGEEVESRYFSNSEFMKLVPVCFRLEQLRGLGIFAIPSINERIRGENTRSFLKRLESSFVDAPLFRRLGDETLFVFQKIQ